MVNPILLLQPAAARSEYRKGGGARSAWYTRYSTGHGHKREQDALTYIVYLCYNIICPHPRPRPPADLHLRARAGAGAGAMAPS